jgi:site-specific DNA recombinase
LPLSAVYTRVSTEHGLEQEFNSLDNQREASEAYVKSQAHEGWKLIRTRYDDGGYSGGSMDRPALQKLLDDVRAHRIDVIVVYKVDRLTRSLADFAKLVELFDAHQVSFVSVTQAFNTTTSMGRLTLNVLLSFAQFEREVTGERIRDKIAASKRKGIWMGGVVPLGYARRGRLGVGRWSRQARISRKSAAMAVIFLAAIEVRSHSLSLIAHEGGRDKTAAP